MSGRLDREVGTFLSQSTALADWLDGFPAVDASAPSVLPGWDVRTLVGHVALIQRGLGAVLSRRAPSGTRALSAADFVARYAGAVADIAANTAEVTAERPLPDLVAMLRDGDGVREAAAGVADRTVLDGPRGPITALDWVITRTVDLVVHCDDVSRTFPARDPVPLLRPALATASRGTAEMLAAAVPGHSVELRVPPFVAVQAVPGPRHTRGTPPNVVETDALTWLRLATGRADFGTVHAAGALRSSGGRADLTAYLPLVR